MENTKDKDYWQKKGQGHRERLREKYQQVGLDGFSDVEVLEFLLCIGTPRRDVKEIAKEVLKRFKSLSGALSQPKEKLMEIKGIGQKNVLYLLLIRDVAKRYLQDKLKEGPVFLNSNNVYEYLGYSMSDLKREVFKVLLLNAKNRLIEDIDLFQGNQKESAVYPSEVIRICLEKGASSVILVHNHPSGDTKPSLEDKDITKRLVWAGRLMDIKILDHIIIGNKEYFSFKDSGLMDEYSFQYDQRFR